MLKNKKIIIVGGSSGIGLSVARKSIDLGAEVVIASRSATKLEEAARQLNGHAQTEVLDAADEGAVAEFCERIGPFDHLAITIKPQFSPNGFLQNDAGKARAAFDSKFWGQYYLARHGAKNICTGGSITFTSGIASCRAYHGYSAVSAMNAAVEALCKAIATELAPIRVNTVCPGFVEAEPHDDSRTRHVRTLAPKLPLDRLGVASEIADAYLYLFSSTYSTGTVVVVDGGAAC